MLVYGYKQIPINNFESIDSNSTNFYNYRGLNFFTKLSKTNEYLVINFHGAVRGRGKDRIIFRGYNYSILNTDIVCISDFLMNVYEEYQVNWCLSSSKYNVEHIYIELFKYLINSKRYINVIFTGSSAGSYPSLYFASIFGKTALFSNPQLYLEKYGFAQRNSKYPWGFYGLAKMLADRGDGIIYEPNTIEYHVLKFRPEKIIIYNNKLDTQTFNDHTIPFVNFLKSNGLEHLVELIIFEGIQIEGKTNHEINFPGKTKHLDAVIKYLKK